MAESKRTPSSSSKEPLKIRETSPLSPRNAPHSSDGDGVRRNSRSPISLENVSVPDIGDESFTRSLLQDVFEETRAPSPVEGAASLILLRKSLSLQNLHNHIAANLKEVSDKETKSSKDGPDFTVGRMGPTDCTFDISTSVGTLIVDPDKLGIASHSNFSSIKASCCVFQGKWVYELMLASKGVMQLGWCTANCRFSQEEGVGDTRDSYAYDGNRLRKWNITTKRYGQPWMSGDVISCAIDCDEGIITFYRNGVSLGEAFNNVRVGPGYAYFPAVSLSFTESVQANFGSLPLRYPVEGYKPLQSPRCEPVAQADLLLTYLQRLLPKMVEDDQCNRQHGISSKSQYSTTVLSDRRSHQATLTLVASHIFHKLAPLLRIPYVVDKCLIKLLLDLCDYQHWQDEQALIHKLLDLIWMLLQEPELRDCLEHLAISLLNGYRYHPFHPEFIYPKKFLALTLSVLKHQRTCRHLLTAVFFERVKFPVFMHIKAPDDPNLARLLPSVWWDKHMKKDEDDSDDSSEEEDVDAAQADEDKKSFMECCERLGEKVEELESMQVELLKCLLMNTDRVDNKTSRDIFLDKLKIFLKENSGFTRLQIAQCALPVSLCFFHRLVQALRFYWDHFSAEDPNFLPSSEAFMPIQCFWNDTRDYYELQRCGGLMSHLNRQLGTEVNRAQGIEVQEDGRVVKKSSKDAGKPSEDFYPKLEMPSGNSLLDLLDCVVLLYHVAAHKQLGKMCALRDSMQDYIQNMRDTERKLKRCPDGLEEVKVHLSNAKKVFEDKIVEQARQMVWVAKVIYSKSKQRDLAWLLKVVLKTVEKASAYHKLFQYVPEFYIQTAVNTFNALKNFLHPTTSFHIIPDLHNLLTRYATFLVNHFFDPRLVSNDLKDTLVQALACLTCYPDTLKVLEELPMERRISMLQSLIAPYENRSWAHTNWILVRIWKGCGFGYRYRYLPNLIPHKAQPTEFSYVSLQKPCPSREFQSLLAKILLDDEARSTKFLDSLMNQLNWSFSEFVGIIQEIQSLATRTEPLLLESRQIKICAACFEISVCLLRVLEMVATVAPQVFTDWSRPSAELFLKRLMQLLSQIMTRVTMKDGAFENTVALPIQGLDSVTFYPILTVTVGVMAQLIVRCGGSSQEKATRSLLVDSSFSLESLKFVLANNVGSKQDKIFSFRKYDEISQEEIEDVEKLLAYLTHQQVALSATQEDVKDEDLCTICYANPQQAIFVPCGHTSCRTCITQQLLNKKECFFCIATITKVTDTKGRHILREHFQTAKKP
ncbi:E3 ubiquitin-protein ligase RNF123-like [Physella acuta]|uniref:E3 ubiquitin-protein ligase RNF123-like n=1 Tax=Physella acuta TaxID=109671 RepID=UPI0027DB0920|nr:E3 ubiquitin-protein ligase RNF123-like [Physella acuta]